MNALPLPRWNWGAVVARWIFVAVFALALFFKLGDMRATAESIGSAGLPAPLLLAWPAALAAGAYVMFLGFAFHGPSRWSASQVEFGFFVDHFTFLAGLLYAAAEDFHGSDPHRV